MRKMAAWGLSVALALGIGGVALAGDQDKDTKDSDAKSGSNWLTWWLPTGKKDADKKKAAADKADKKKGDTPKAPPTIVETAHTIRNREELKYLRRVAVCDRLKEIADQTDDAGLRRKAEQLEERAWAVYQERTKSLAITALPGGTGTSAGDKQLHQGANHPQRMRSTTLHSVSGTDVRGVAKEELP